MLQEVGKTLDGRTSVTVKMGKTRDGTVRDIYVTDRDNNNNNNNNNNKSLLITNLINYISFPPQIAYKLIEAGRSKNSLFHESHIFFCYSTSFI